MENLQSAIVRLSSVPGMKLRFVVGMACGTALVALLIQGVSGVAASLQPGQWHAGVQRSTAELRQANAQTPSFDPTSIYRRGALHGFTVLVNPAVLKHPPEASALWQELDAQLAAIVRVVPAKPLSALQQVRIWVEWANRDGAAEFHPSVEWLTQHGYNPDKAGGVEVSNTRNFVQWSRLDQPWMLLHELAHAYHHRVLGDNDAGIQMAYQHAVTQGLYQSIAYIKGGKRKAYALTNEKEYFAELSESYFGKNDFYPFTRSELKTYDPIGYRLMEQRWGKPRTSDRKR